MSDAQVHDFQKRVRDISRQHRKLSRGNVQLVERDGLLVPKRSLRVRGAFPVRGLLLTLIGFMLFKGFVFMQAGAINYNDRVAKLAEGNTAEQVGAWVLQADPITRWIADTIASYI